MAVDGDRTVGPVSSGTVTGGVGDRSSFVWKLVAVLHQWKVTVKASCVWTEALVPA